MTGAGEWVKPHPKCKKCPGKQVNFNACGNCVDKQEVCDAEEDDCLKDEDACEAIPDATFCPSSKGGKDKCGKSKCGKFGKCGEGYWDKESGKGGKFKCAKNKGCDECDDDDFINYESCGNCRNKEEVCAEHNEEDEDCDEDEE